jgi:hypothetical protein
MAKKCQNICIKAYFESPKNILHQTFLENLRYLQQTAFKMKIGYIKSSLNDKIFTHSSLPITKYHILNQEVQVDQMGG